MLCNYYYECIGAYAEKYHGVSLSGIRWPFVFGVRCLWLHNFTSYSCFQIIVLAKYVDTLCIFFYTHSPYFVCHCTEYKLSALQGSKTHSSLRQSNLQLQNQAARMSRQIRAVERIGVRLDWLAHTRVCKIKSCQTTQELKMRKSTQENFRFLVLYRSPGFLFSLLKHYQIPEWLYANNCCFWARATVLSCYRNW